MQRSTFVQNIIKDYIKWFTKIGSIETVFEILHNTNFKIFLKGLDVDEFEEITFGHIFPDENSDIQKLFEELDFDKRQIFMLNISNLKSRDLKITPKYYLMYLFLLKAIVSRENIIQ